MFGSPLGHSWSTLAAGIVVRIDRQNFFVIEIFLQADLPNYLIVRCFIYHHSAPHQLLCYHILTSYNKSTVLPFKICDYDS
jgi:hypothetical protein